MKVIVAGSRTIQDYAKVKAAIEKSGFKISRLISGHAIGVDILGEKWAKENGVPVTLFIPNWGEYGKKAGPMRNEEMARFSDALVALHDGESRGTSHMISFAKKLGLKVYVEKV